MNNNVFRNNIKFFHSPVYATKNFFRSIKWAWQRATKGYCDLDLWNLNTFYTKLFVSSLNEFADMKKWGYPDSICGSIDEWSQIVRDIASQFYLSSDEAYEDLDEDFCQLCARKVEGGTSSKEEWEVMRKRIADSMDAKDRNRREGFKALCDIWGHLWD